EEVEAHLEHETERQVRQRGLDPANARHAARRHFGNVLGAVERHHDAQRWLWAERLGQHLRYGLRSLAQRPAFSVTSIASLGIGIGFLTTIFTIYYAIAYR